MKWFRLENETIKAYQAFCVYVVMHPESVMNVAKALGERLSVFTNWSKKHDWQARKEIFLEYISAKSNDNMCFRHIKEAIALQAKALQKFKTIEPDKLSNSEVVRFLTAGANLERVARRAFEDINAIESGDDFEKIEAFLED